MPTAVAQLALRFGPAQLAGIETGLSAVYSCWLGVLPGQLRGRLVLTDPTTDLDATDIEVFGHRKQRVGRTGWNDTAGMKSGRVHLASWGGADLPLAMDLLAGNDDVRPGAAALRRRALAALPAAVCGRVRVRADAGNLDGALARAATRAGCEAALAAKGNTAVRDIEDQAFALDGSLDSTEKGKAVLDSSYIDLVLGAGQDCKTIQAEGRASSAMTANQQMGLLTLIDHDGGLANDEDAAAREAQLKADLAATTFAWCGPTTAGSAAYVRLTGPHLVIEYSPQSMGGDAADHIHGIYRDLTNDHGAQPARDAHTAFAAPGLPETARAPGPPAS